MITRTILRCSHCKAIAREYFGIKGGVYIGGETKFICSESTNGEHDFKPTKEKEPLLIGASKKKRKEVIDYIKKFFPKDLTLSWVIDIKKKLNK